MKAASRWLAARLHLACTALIGIALAGAALAAPVATVTPGNDIRLQPVSAAEKAGPLRAIGVDIGSGWDVSEVRFAAHLFSQQPLAADQLTFAVRDEKGTVLDAEIRGNITRIGGSSGADLRVRASRSFAPGRYTYWLAYRQGERWYELGQRRTFTIRPRPALPAPLQTGRWVLDKAASDEFDGTQLDAGRWQMPFFPASAYHDRSGQERRLLGFNPSQVSVSGGLLRLTVSKKPFADAPYSAGAAESRFEIPGEPSYTEIRARTLDSRANVLSAIWFQHMGADPQPEIDLQETFDDRALTSTLHLWPLSGPHEQTNGHIYPLGADLSRDFHTYGLERRGGWLRMYLDGQLAWEVRPDRQELATMPRHILFTLEAHLANPSIGRFPADGLLPQAAFVVDYVRTYRLR